MCDKKSIFSVSVGIVSWFVAAFGSAPNADFIKKTYLYVDIKEFCDFSFVIESYHIFISFAIEALTSWTALTIF